MKVSRTSPQSLEQSKETEADESSSNKDRVFPKLGEMLTGVSINKALIRKKATASLWARWNEERIRMAGSILICSHGGMSHRGRLGIGSSNHPLSRTLWLCSEPTGWPVPHIARAHGCWCVCLHEYAQPLGFETSPWLIAVGGLPLPLCWRKWRGKKENERAQRRRRGRL